VLADRQTSASSSSSTVAVCHGCGGGSAGGRQSSGGGGGRVSSTAPADGVGAAADCRPRPRTAARPSGRSTVHHQAGPRVRTDAPAGPSNWRPRQTADDDDDDRPTRRRRRTRRPSTARLDRTPRFTSHHMFIYLCDTSALKSSAESTMPCAISRKIMERPKETKNHKN